jgi:hypothetical protein
LAQRSNAVPPSAFATKRFIDDYDKIDAETV